MKPKIKPEYRTITSAWIPSADIPVKTDQHLSRRFHALYGDPSLEKLFFENEDEIEFHYMYSKGIEWIELKIFRTSIHKNYDELFARFNEKFRPKAEDYHLKIRCFGP